MFFTIFTSCQLEPRDAVERADRRLSRRAVGRANEVTTTTAGDRIVWANRTRTRTAAAAATRELRLLLLLPLLLLMMMMMSCCPPAKTTTTTTTMREETQHDNDNDNDDDDDDADGQRVAYTVYTTHGCVLCCVMLISLRLLSN